MASDFNNRPEVEKKRVYTIFAERFFLGLVVAYVLVSSTITGLNAIAAFQTRDALLDCVTPGGDCYAEGQKRTGEAVQQLIQANKLDEVATQQIVIAASTCAERVQNDTVEKIQDCVDEIIAQQGE